MTDPPGSGTGPDEPDQSRNAEREAGRRILPSNRYSLIIGLIFAAIAAFALVNTITSRESGTLGLGEEEPGTPLAPFAVPDVTSSLEGDANIDPDKACEVDLPGAIRLCDFAARPLVISFWFTRGGDCTEQQDVVSAVHARYGDRVGLLSINIRDDREHVAELAESRGWSMPVGHDRDGALSNLYRVGGCPTFVFARPGLLLDEAVIGDLSEEELADRVDHLLSKTKRDSSGPTGPDAH